MQGRDVERTRLAALLDAARRGRAGAVVVTGEPGAGKTALLDHLVSSAADGDRVVRTRGLESESPLPFAALHRVLTPLRNRFAELPVPQAHALGVAFGEREGAPVEPFLIGVATLSVLSAAAEDSTVLCVVDDAHWLDSASADALLFAARRLEADRVAMVFGARDTPGRSFVHDGLASLPLRGLELSAVRSLLVGHFQQVGDDVVQRLASETGGNPLALLEIAGMLSAEQLNGTAPLPAQLRISAGVEQLFLDQVRRLREPVQTLLLVVAADDTGRLATTRSAAARLGADLAAWDEAERSRLVVVDGDTVSVRHPLVRSAVHQAATALERREVHLALAAALSEAGDEDRAVWHRAVAAEGPDESIATQLTTVATRSENRGGHAAAATAFERAAELSFSDESRGPRLYAAARNLWESGQADHARRLATAGRQHAVDPLLRADIDRLRGRIEVNVGSAAAAHRIFTEAARTVAPVDPARALEMAVAAALMRAHGADSGTGLDAAAIPTDPASGDSARVRCLKQLLVAVTADLEGDSRAGVAALEAALATGAQVDDLDLLGNLGNAALHVGDDAAARRFYTAMLTTAQDRGAGMWVVYALQRLAFPQYLAGRWTELRASSEEALALSRSVGQQALAAAPLAWLTLLAALQGRDDYERLLAETEDVSARHSLGILTDPVRDLTSWAQGVRALHAGEAALALGHLTRLRVSTLWRMTTPDRVEAAVRAGEADQAVTWIDELASFATATRWPWAQTVVDYGRALLADSSPDPDQLFARALDGGDGQSPGRDPGRPYDRARVDLAYGEWLRRNRQRVHARRHLRSAMETFTDLQAAPLLARATEELRASGESARKRDPSTLLQLTPMEQKVAQLVSSGLSNKDVAAQCWISPRTVAFHLRNVFAKTGVTSRGELAQLSIG